MYDSAAHLGDEENMETSGFCLSKGANNSACGGRRSCRVINGDHAGKARVNGECTNSPLIF